MAVIRVEEEEPDRVGGVSLGDIDGEGWGVELDVSEKGLGQQLARRVPDLPIVVEPELLEEVM